MALKFLFAFFLFSLHSILLSLLPFPLSHFPPSLFPAPFVLFPPFLPLSPLFPSPLIFIPFPFSFPFPFPFSSPFPVFWVFFHTLWLDTHQADSLPVHYLPTQHKREEEIPGTAPFPEPFVQGLCDLEIISRSLIEWRHNRAVLQAGRVLLFHRLWLGYNGSHSDIESRGDYTVFILPPPPLQMGSPACLGTGRLHSCLVIILPRQQGTIVTWQCYLLIILSLNYRS